MDRIAIVNGVRTPFIKSGSHFRDISADDIGTLVLRHLINSSAIDANEIDELIVGNVAQPSNAANISRVIGLKAGLPQSIPAYTVHRNCASGMESISSAMNKIWSNQASIIVAGGVESMSNIPFLYSKRMQTFFESLMRARSLFDKFSILKTFRLSFLKPIIGLVDGLTDPFCGQLMGMTAENLAREFVVSREDQDKYALESHVKAIKAIDSGVLQQECMPIYLGPDFNQVIQEDNGPRNDQSLERLHKLKPYFDRKNGTVTVGNSCPITDGAGMVLLMSESEAKRRNLNPMGYVRAYDYAGLEPHRMGLGPVYATSKLLQKTDFKMKDFDLIEMNEAFAAQIIANLRAFGSKSFAQEFLNQTDCVGEIDESILNINGGAIALGHPVGVTGLRLILTLLHNLKREKKSLGLATLCVGGGQGGSFIVEVDN